MSIEKVEFETLDDGTIEVGTFLAGAPEPYIWDIEPEESEALEKFYQHRQDEKLGRWRSEKYPEVVVYRESAIRVTVVRDLEGTAPDLYRGATLDPLSQPDYIRNSVFGEVIAEYVAAHPEPKPWLEAKPGEVWKITSRFGHFEDEMALVDGETFVFLNPMGSMGVDRVSIVGVLHAERVYPAPDTEVE